MGGALTCARGAAVALAVTGTVAITAAPAAQAEDGAPPPTPAQCAAVRAQRELPPLESYDPKPGAIRVFAMQFKQDLANVTTYAAFRTKIECLIREYVLPRLAPGEANVVAFNEDVGLATLVTGSRGAAARAAFGRPGRPGCESEGIPCATLAGLASVSAAYAPQEAAYEARFPGISPIAATFVAATDTFARGWMRTFSDMAKRYGVYMVGSATQAPFKQSTNPADIALFHDPDYPTPSAVYVATSGKVYNEVFMWGPHDVRAGGPDVLRNVVASNRKLPLTPLEQEIGLSPGPSSGAAAIANLRPYAIPATGARIGFATSLPAFVYGNPPPGTDPCSDTSRYYMRCLDELGANVVIQDEANDGRWAAANGSGIWQPLDWMGSAWRAVSDPTVRFDYAVNPMMVGNLADLVFDGQSAITQRGLTGPGCHYVGNAVALPGDPPGEQAWAGDKPQFLELAPWVTPDAQRAQLETTAAELAPGSDSPLENDYVETALVADLPFPPDGNRPGCAG